MVKKRGQGFSYPNMLDKDKSHFRYSLLKSAFRIWGGTILLLWGISAIPAFAFCMIVAEVLGIKEEF